MTPFRLFVSATIVVAAVLSALSVYLVWWERDRVWLYAWLIPAGVATAEAVIARLPSRGAELPSQWLGRRLAVFALAALVAGWAYIPVLLGEATVSSRGKSATVVHAIRVEARIREFHRMVHAAERPWVVAAVSAGVATALLRTRYAAALAAAGAIHVCGCWIYAEYPLDRWTSGCVNRHT